MSNEITTPYDRVLINPNEPLILPDGTAITGRLETFLYALCCLDYDNLPTPLSRIEEFANALITGEIPNIEPQSRSEQFFLAILDGNIDNLPEPQSRSEVLLNKLAVGDFDLTNVDPIQSRYELLLAYLIKNGGVGNLDYVLYEFYQATQTLYNTQEKPVKSAILKGQTLVNLVTVSGSKTLNSTDRFWNLNPNYELSITNKKYLFIGEVKNNILAGYNEGVRIQIGNTFVRICDINSYSGMVKQVITITSDDNNKICRLYIGGNDANNGVSATIENPMLIEYQEGMENWDIPYFEGIQSVKMPVLTTTTKNLFNIKSPYQTTSNGMITDNALTVDGENGNTFNYIARYKIPLAINDAGKLYAISSTKTGGEGAIEIRQYDEDDKLLFAEALNSNSTIKISENSRYFSMTFSARASSGLTTWTNIQVEKDSVVTSYEPHKSNILTVNEDVTLRSNGDVYDELNLLTGRLTQRIDENNEVLAQEVVKTVDLSVIDQDGNVLPKIKTFNDTTHVNVSSYGILPKVEMEVATYNEEDIANANVMTASMDEIYSVQNELDNTNSIQSEEIDSTMIASTEIYENIL